MRRRELMARPATRTRLWWAPIARTGQRPIAPVSASPSLRSAAVNRKDGRARMPLPLPPRRPRACRSLAAAFRLAAESRDKAYRSFERSHSRAAVASARSRLVRIGRQDLLRRRRRSTSPCGQRDCDGNAGGRASVEFLSGLHESIPRICGADEAFADTVHIWTTYCV
jgi:hypothetical protein